MNGKKVPNFLDLYRLQFEGRLHPRYFRMTIVASILPIFILC